MEKELPWPDAKGDAWQGHRQPSALPAACLGSVGVFVGACAHVACFVVLLVVFIVVWANDNRGRWLAAAFHALGRFQAPRQEILPMIAAVNWPIFLERG